MTEEKKDKIKNKTAKKESKKEREFDEVVLEVRRVTRVVAGGKRFSFRAVVVIGDRKGRVGVGLGKGLDVADSVRKARADAEANLISFKLKDGRTIPYDVDAKHGSAKVRVKPAREGHGLIAGGAARAVLDLAGVKDVSAKILGATHNKLNNALATLKALKNFSDNN